MTPTQLDRYYASEQDHDPSTFAPTALGYDPQDGDPLTVWDDEVQHVNRHHDREILALALILLVVALIALAGGNLP